MRNTFRQRVLLATVCAALLLLGCETESTGSAAVSISPSYKRVQAGGIVTLTASGGWNYQWSLRSDSAVGTLSATTGSQVVYTALKDSATQVVRVTCSTGSNSGTIAYAETTIVQGSSSYAQDATSSASNGTIDSGAGDSSSSGGSSSGGSSGSGTSTLAWNSSPPPTLAVGESATVSVKNFSSASKISWTLTADSGLGLSKSTGSSNTIKGNSVGTWTLTVADSGTQKTVTANITVE